MSILAKDFGMWGEGDEYAETPPAANFAINFWSPQYIHVIEGDMEMP